MDTRISKIRQVIRALRVSMRKAEAIMHEQINRDEDCTFVALEIVTMRTVMAELVRDRATLGDNEPIVVQSLFIPRRASAPSRIAKRRLVPPALAQQH